MDFEWDEAKSDVNFRTRGFGFDFAALVFRGLVLEAADLRADYGERRIRAIGEANGFILVVI